MPDDINKAQALKEQLQQCNGFEGDETANARKDALDYYFQRPRGDEVVGRSDVVSGDISAMVEATVAQMVDAFTTDRIADFDPLGPEDEDQAQLESDAVQWFVMGKENGLIELIMSIKEAVLLRNAVIYIDAEDKTTRRVKRLGNVEPEAYAELRAGSDVVADKYDPETKELHLTIERTSREFIMNSVPMSSFVYHTEWHKPCLEGIPVCAVRHITSRADLIAMGLPKDKVNGLTAHKTELQSERKARDPRHHKHATKSYDTSQELVEWYDVFIRAEAPGGIDELRRIKFSYQDTVELEDKPAPFLNLAAGTAILNPHRFTGISLYDKLKQNQDIRTQLRRALLDNVNATTKHRLAGLDNVVNADDVTDGRVNNMVRVKTVVPDVRQAVMPLAVPDTSANILANLESTAKERSEMGGAALDLQTAQMQIGGDRMGSQGLDRAYSVAEQLSAAMMKTLAATLIRETFLLAHRVLREYFDEPVPIKRNGKWTYVTPSEWPERQSVTIKPGMSPGEKTRRVNALTDIIESQIMLSERGMEDVLVDINGFNRAVLDRARLQDIQNPEQYYLDPQSPESQAALKSKARQREEEKMQKAALMQNSFGLEQVRTALEKYRHDTELQFKYYDSVIGTEVEEAKILGSATSDLAALQRQGTNGQSGQDSTGERTTEQSASAGDTGES